MPSGRISWTHPAAFWSQLVRASWSAVGVHMSMLASSLGGCGGKGSRRHREDLSGGDQSWTVAGKGSRSRSSRAVLGFRSPAAKVLAVVAGHVNCACSCMPANCTVRLESRVRTGCVQRKNGQRRPRPSLFDGVLLARAVRGSKQGSPLSKVKSVSSDLLRCQ